MDEPVQVTIDGLPYNVVSSDKSDQAVFGPRFGAGSEDESDLTLLKTLNFNAVDYGSFSHLGDEFSPFVIKGVADYANSILRNPYELVGIDESAYNTSLDVGSYTLMCSTIWQGKTILAYRVRTKNYLYAYDPEDQSFTAIPVPASAADSFHTYHVSSFSFRDNVMYITTLSSSGIWYLNEAMDTLTKVPSSVGGWRQVFNLNGHMYNLSKIGNISEYTGTTSAEASTQVTKIYDANANAQSPIQRPLAVLNGRAYIAIPDKGLWAFDGVRAYEVINTEASSSRNFDFLVAASGYLYFNRGTVVYRFNGGTIEKLFEFPRDTVFESASVVDDNVYITTTAVDDDEFSLKYDPTPTSFDVGIRVFMYDGVNMYYLLTKTWTYPAGKSTAGAWVSASPAGLLISLVVGATASLVNTLELSELHVPNADEAWSSTEPVEIIFDREEFGLPSINKILKKIKLDFLDMLDLTTGGDTIKFYYRTDESTDWTLAKTFSTNAVRYLAGFDVEITPASRYYFRLDIGGANIQWESLQLLYILQVPYRAQWNLLLNPASNTVENPEAYLATYLSKIEELRTSQEVFTFTDVNGSDFNVIVDSFNQRVNPAYAPNEDEPAEAQISVVLREV